jgi:MFS family permease
LLIGAVRSWQAVFLVVGLPGLLISLLFFTVREPARRGSAAAASGPLPVGALIGYVRANARTFASQSLGFACSAAVNFGVGGWLATFLVRTYHWSPARAGLVQGSLTATVGVAGVVAGGWLADALARRGMADAPLRVGMVGAAGMLVSASAFPLMPNASLAVLWLVVVNFFAAFPWGAASLAAAEVVPPPLRAQGAAVYFFVVALLSRTLGPTAVALLTDHVFGEAGVRYSLVCVNIIGMTLALGLFAYGLPAYRATVARRDRWMPPVSSAA